MCVVSMIGDHYQDKWNPVWNEIRLPSEVSKADFEKLKTEVEEMKKLLERAVEYDKKNNEPHCEKSEKVELLKKVAEFVGVDLKDLI